MSRIVAAFAAAATTTIAASAFAAPEPIADTTPWSQTTHVGLEFGVTGNLLFSAPGYNATGLGWVLTGQGEVIPSLFVGGRVGLGYATQTQSLGPLSVTTDQATYSNVPVGAHYAKTAIKDTLAFWAGGRIGIPVLADPSPEVVGASALMVTTTALYGPDLFIPRYLPIRLGGGVEAGFKAGPGAVLVRGELLPHLWIPLFDNSEAEFLIETAAEGEWRHTSGLGGGLRLQGVFLATGSVLAPTANSTDAQLAMEPFVGFFPESLPVYARLGVLFALDEPLGVAAGRDVLTTFRLFVGWKLPK